MKSDKLSLSLRRKFYRNKIEEIVSVYNIARRFACPFIAEGLIFLYEKANVILIDRRTVRADAIFDRNESPQLAIRYAAAYMKHHHNAECNAR